MTIDPGDRGVYIAIARNLREFGYPDVTPTMIQEIDEAIRAKTELPHGIIGMFAQSQLEDAAQNGRLSR